MPDRAEQVARSEFRKQAAEDRFTKSVERALAAGLRVHVLVGLVHETAHEVGKEDPTKEEEP